MHRLIRVFAGSTGHFVGFVMHWLIGFSVNKIWLKSCFEPPHDKTNKMSVHPAKTDHVWSESSLCTQWIAMDLSFLHADSEDSDQTGRMPRLRDWCGCPGWSESSLGAHAILLVLSWGGSFQMDQFLSSEQYRVSEHFFSLAVVTSSQSSAHDLRVDQILSSLLLKSVFNSSMTQNKPILDWQLQTSVINWASSWDYGTYHIGDERRLRQACTCMQSHQSLRCSYTWSMEVHEGSEQNSDF